MFDYGGFDSYSLADDVIVSGVLTSKWAPELKDVRCDLDPVLIANNVRCKRSSHHWYHFYDSLIVLGFCIKENIIILLSVTRYMF